MWYQLFSVFCDLFCGRVSSLIVAVSLVLEKDACPPTPSCPHQALKPKPLGYQDSSSASHPSPPPGHTHLTHTLLALTLLVFQFLFLVLPPALSYTLCFSKDAFYVLSKFPKCL